MAINMINQNHPTNHRYCVQVLLAAEAKKASIAGMHRSLLIEEIKKIVVVFRRRPISSYRYFCPYKARLDFATKQSLTYHSSSSVPNKTVLCQERSEIGSSDNFTTTSVGVFCVSHVFLHKLPMRV